MNGVIYRKDAIFKKKSEMRVGTIRKYISTTDGIPIDCFWGVSKHMARDMTKIIDTLRDTAVGRCRERLEQAALRAKGLIRNGNSTGKSESPPAKAPEYGVTSLLKRKHGL